MHNDILIFHFVLADWFLLAITLKRRYILNWTCFLCITIEEDDIHTFFTCQGAIAIWVVISQIWASLTCTILSPFHWVFIDGVRALPIPSYQVVFYYHRLLGMWYN